ncbi:DEAD/DEAH box helicase [Candidatus Parcubacteria bacterium]|nr:DEAD/DEAH box helicase [Candidatus Parcubacteria bacterium]
MNQDSGSLLKSSLKRLAGSVIYSRGMGYYRLGHVESLRVFLFGSEKNKIEIRGEIAGTSDYKASLEFDLQKIKFTDSDCSCPCDFDCKHSVALGLKFADFFQAFLNQVDESYREISADGLRKKLVDWVNNQDLAKNYAFDEYDEERDYEIERESEEDDEIIDGEFEDIEPYYKNQTKDELMDELKDALDIGDAPRDVIDRLIRAIADKGMDKKVKKKNTVIPSTFPRTPKWQYVRKKFNAEKYYIVIKINYNNKISSVEIKKNNHVAMEPGIFLQDYDDVTKIQKELFKFLESVNFYYNISNYEKLFKLLRDSEIKIFFEKKSNASELIFVKELENEKIKCELNLLSRICGYGEKSQKKFVFKLDDEYKESKPFLFFFGKKSVVKIDGQNVSFHELSESLVKLLESVELEKYRYNEYKKYFETILKEDEVIKLNEIIKDCRKYLDLKTKIKPDFQVIKSVLAEPCMLVGYDNKKDLLEIQAVIDYGIEKVDVGRSVRRYHSKGRDSFQRWGDDKYIIKTSKEKIEYAPIKRKKEIDLYRQFCYFGKDCGFKRSVECKVEGEKEIFKYFKNHWENVEKLGYKIEFINDEFQFIKEDFTAGFNVDLNAENDWLRFDVDCHCGKDKIGLNDLKKYITDKKEFIKLNNGKILKITNPEELERFILMLESFHAKENNNFEGKLYHAAELEYIFTSSDYYNAKVEKSFKNFIKEAKSGKPIRKIKLPTRFDKVLRDYQKDGINWFYFLRKYRFAGILADDMGLGKTLQTLVLIEKEKVKNKPSIVICPKTLLYNWQSEVEKFTPKLKTIVIDGFPEERKKLIKQAKNCDLVITGYASMQKDYEVYDKQKVKFNYCVLDEAQFIKNHATKNAQIVKKINADYRLALTGTPLENSVSEIWSIFDFLMPGFLGSFNAFKKKFQTPIMKHSDKLALRNLRKKIECFMLRRSKSEVLKELPPKIEQVSRCHLEKAQNILYQEILTNVKKEIFDTVKEKGFNKSRIHILAGLTKLRQVCNHPVLLLKDKDYTKYESAKLNMFMELIDEIVSSKNKVLVFSQFTKMLDILAKELNKNNISYSYLSGKTNKRQDVIKDFNENSDKQVFLISLKAGGTGLNLTSASNVIIFDPWWNPSVENQAIDRTHRIGQKKSVNVYRLIMNGTIEERIVKLQEKKKFLFDSLIGESKDLFVKLTWDDIKGLFE